MLALPSALIFSYFLSLLFTKQETARTIFGSALSLFTVVPYLLVSLIDIFGSRNTARAIHYLFAIIDPYYPITGVLYYVNMMSLIHTFAPGLPPLTVGDYFQPDAVVFPTLLIMVAHIVVFSTGIYVVDFYITRVREGQIRPWDAQALRELKDKRERRGGAGRDEMDDEDVIAERRRVGEQVTGMSANASGMGDLEMAGNGMDEVMVVDARKEYGKGKKKKTAVEWSSWGVRKGELFGLLGPNGAGKTTSLSMAIGAIPPTHGNIYIHQTSIFSRTANPYSYMGYCPQFDALWHIITVQEHIDLFATLKGITPTARAARVKALMRKLDIEEYAQKRSGTLSGGNKRKLSFAISVCGDPSVVFLDEPSTGIDPASRRYMWNLLLETRKNRATILTTHSMEEADALSTRIAIQVSGRLRCIGTPQHLKSKFGDGYQLEIQSSPPVPGATPIHDRILSLYPSATLLEHFGGMRRYRIPVTDFARGRGGRGGLGGVFAVLEGLKREGAVTDYAFSQTTLDQVFIEFAKKQEEEDIAAANAAAGTAATNGNRWGALFRK
ncbi:ATP-binding cassette sub- A member 5 [Borealophlyctis nickersoniae]|nr:ATP-binding cassette sub- A member 5 [Borealophlyctis nickersoniae]